MTGRRPLSSHQGFVAFVALWCAALFGLVVFVLPDPVLSRALAGTGVVGLADNSPTSTLRLICSVAAALVGGAIGLLAVMLIARSNRRDPRPVYDGAEIFESEPPAEEIAFRRPLRVREELEADMLEGDDGCNDAAPDDGETVEETTPSSSDPAFTPISNEPMGRDAATAEGESAPQGKPRQDDEAETEISFLVAQFDAALASYREHAGDRPLKIAGEEIDPLETFLARQAGASARQKRAGNERPDNQAELRQALDRLDRARRKD